MSKFNFQIDKKICFVRWAKSLVRWEVAFDPREYEYYVSVGGILKKNETQALEQFKKILQKKDNGYLWLWRRHKKEKIKNKKERALWQNIQNTLQDKFDKTWRDESLGLLLWQNILMQYDFQEVHEVLNRIAVFFHVQKIPDNISVNLIFHWNEKYSNGTTLREFDDILIGVSHLKKQYLSRVIGTLVHELTHKIENVSPISNRLTGNSYAKIILPYHLPTPDRQWRYLFAESIVTSIAGFPYDNNYTQKTLFKKNDRATAYNQNIDHYRVQVRIVAQKIAPLTAKYLRQGKTMDKKFCDTVAKEWLKLKQSI